MRGMTVARDGVESTAVTDHRNNINVSGIVPLLTDVGIPELQTLGAVGVVRSEFFSKQKESARAVNTGIFHGPFRCGVQAQNILVGEETTGGIPCRHFACKQIARGIALTNQGFGSRASNSAGSRLTDATAQQRNQFGIPGFIGDPSGSRAAGGF